MISLLLKLGKRFNRRELSRKARAKGISDEGELIVTLSDGKERHVFSGEVSVRGIYGYV